MPHVIVITNDKDYSMDVIGPFTDEAIAEDHLVNHITLDARATAVVAEIENPDGDGTTTTAIVNVTTHETRTYVFDETLDSDEVVARIQTGTYDPTDSRIHVEDLDVIDVNHS